MWICGPLVKTVSRELLAAHRARQGRTSFYGAPAPQHRSTRLGANVLECFALRFWAARSLERQCRGPQRSRRAMTASERGAGSSGRSSASPSGRHALETMISIAFGLLPPLVVLLLSLSPWPSCSQFLVANH